MQPTFGEEFTLNPLFYLGTMKLGLNPSVTALKSGRLAVVWQDYSGADGDVFGDSHVYVRLFKTDGTPITDAIKVNSKDAGAQGEPEVTALADGGFLVSWTNVNSLLPDTDNDIYFRAFDANGTPRSKQILASSDHEVPAVNDGADYNDNDTGDVLGLQDGNAIVLYTHRGEAATYAHVVTKGGTVLGEEVKVFDTTDSAVTMTQLANGDVVISYPSYSYNGAVVRISGPDLVSPPKGLKGATDPVILEYFNDGDHDQTPGDSSMTGLTGDYLSALPGGGFIMGYKFDPDIRSDSQIDSFRIDWFDNSGTYQRSADVPFPGSEESLPYDVGRVIALSGDRILVIWQIAIDYGDYDIKAQILDASGKPLGDAIEINTTLSGTQLIAEETVLPDGNVAIVFSDQSGIALDGTIDGLHGRVLIIPDDDSPTGPSKGDDKLVGTARADTIDGLGGDDVILGKGGADVLNGSGGHDTLKGQSGNDRLLGGAGNDRLIGGPGKDTLLGGGGKDTLDGGAGADKLTGGKGADTFVFATAKQARGDTVKDFSSRQGDVLDMSRMDADTSIRGDQDFVLIGSDAFSGRAGELRTWSNKGETFVAGDVNGDGKADLKITLDGRYDLVDADFLL
ncbi:calcium-binding protein [Pseudodonghicola flavimaris]|uniref:Calcium-binding protein n=1 Tax=Pseudodonghicola flavimaris TaxID=3050036 RepID=A0ABT7F833_9RHOB|nr:hypothetical protein [Pseudodonghicola flavimaris]MDK3020770.1 hypothetical protein [Pseudodonghicola flavimaris]